MHLTKNQQTNIFVFGPKLIYRIYLYSLQSSIFVAHNIYRILQYFIYLCTHSTKNKQTNIFLFVFGPKLLYRIYLYSLQNSIFVTHNIYQILQYLHYLCLNSTTNQQKNILIESKLFLLSAWTGQTEQSNS
jgi:hypothetical protein